MATPGTAVHEFESSLAGRPVGAAAVMALFAFAVSYFRSFVFPATPLVLWGDYVGFFNDGSRIAAGQLPYRDYFKVVTPGTDLIYALLIKTFGLRLWIPPLVMALLAAVVALLITLIAAQVTRGKWVLLPALMFTGFALIYSNDATHHWFSTIFVLAAVLVLLRGVTLRGVATAGVCCGLAACFTQTRGVLAVAGFAVYLLQKPEEGQDRARRWKSAILLCACAAAVFFVCNVYFIYAAGWRQWWFCLLEYPLRYYPAPAINNWRVLTYEFADQKARLKWLTFPVIYGMIPLSYAALVITGQRRGWNRGDESSQRVLLVAIAGIALVLAVISAPSVKRVSISLAPALVLLAWVLAEWRGRLRLLRNGIGLCAIAMALLLPLRTQTQHYLYVAVPAGRAALSDAALADEYHWLAEHTHPGQYLFGLAPLYFTFHLRNPAPIEGYHGSEYTRPEQVAGLLRAVESHDVPLIVLRWPYDPLNSSGGPSDHLGPFRSYLLSNYHVSKSFSTGDVVWERNLPFAPQDVGTK